MNPTHLLESVLSSLGEQVVVLDGHGTIIAANQGWDESAAAAESSAGRCGIGVNYLDVCRGVSGEGPDEDAMLAAAAIESVIAGEARSRNVEYVCDLPSGPALFLMTVKALGGSDRGALVIHRRSGGDDDPDPETLKNSVDQFRRMVDVMPALISYVDSDRRYRFVNRRYTDWFGHEREEVVGKHLDDVIGPEAYEEIRPDLERVFRGEEVSFEKLINYKDAGNRFVRGNFIPDLDEMGAVRGYFALLIDASEHHRVENELRLSEERFSKMFNFIPIAITISSLKDGKYVSVNEAYLKISGFERERVIGRPTAESGVRMPEDRVRAFFDHLTLEGSVANFETDLFYDDGRQKTVLLNAVNLELGGESYLAVAANNITERKQAERSTQDLTTRLLNSQDEERRRIARELHDTTAQKISAILLSLSYLRKLIGKPKKEVEQAIEESIAFAEESLGEIRTLSYVLHPPLLDHSGLRAAVRWFVDGFSRRSGINVEIAFGGEEKRLPQEMEGSMFRIVQEALTNVHRHSGSSNAFILLEQCPTELLLEVRDEGRSILRHDFEAESPTLTEIERLGVGVTGMRERIRQFGGEININFEAEGTIVTARIPLYD